MNTGIRWVSQRWQRFLLGGAVLLVATGLRYRQPPQAGEPVTCRNVGPGVLLSLQRAGPVRVLDFSRGGRAVAGAERLAPAQMPAVRASLRGRPVPVVLLGTPAFIDTVAPQLAALPAVRELYYVPNELLEIPTFADLPQMSPAQYAARPLPLIDFAETHEFQHAHVAGSRRLQFEALLAGDRSALPPRTQPVALICPLGRRSQLAGRILRREGYRVYNIEGGFIAWQACGLPTECERRGA